MDDRERRIGFAAYRAYAAAMGDTLKDGLPIRRWDALTPQEQAAWVAVADAVCKEVGGIY